MSKYKERLEKEQKKESATMKIQERKYSQASFIRRQEGEKVPVFVKRRTSDVV